MKDTQSQTESLLDIVKGIDARSIMLPEFQRDFRWELEQTYDLIDSLIREIFIGTIIYGKPSFGMTLREIDRRPRKGKGSNEQLKTQDYSTKEITELAKTQNLRIVLDGQQRTTSIYRAMVGRDNVYLVLKNDLDATKINELSLEEMVDSVEGEESRNSISVKLSDAYEAEVAGHDDEQITTKFEQGLYASKTLGATNENEAERKAAGRIYRRAVRRLIHLFNQQKMVAYYLLDMSLDKFCVFFERSNSRGIQLNFTDILAAKLYNGFNLRKKVDEFESQPKFTLNREVIVRTIAYISASEKGRAIAIDRKSILENLEAIDFQKYWDTTCSLYASALRYLASQHYILSQEWMPSENMLIPLMLFLREIKEFSQMSEQQRRFVEFWYWASIFSNRYSSSSNEAIISDSKALIQVAHSERISTPGYFVRLRSLVSEPDDLLSYTKKSSAIYRGILNLIGYASHGLSDWKNTQKIDIGMRLDDHHIYPRAYILSCTELDMDLIDAQQLVDCVVNRTLIPKTLNIQIGKKAPSDYLAEIQKTTNAKLTDCLESHLLPSDMVTDMIWNHHFKLFLEERSKAIFGLIENIVIDAAGDMATMHAVQGTFSPAGGNAEGDHPRIRERLKDLIASGKVKAGDRVYTRRRPEVFAQIVDDRTVEFDGELVLINTWGQKVTGWPSINIYGSVYLEKTGLPLGSLRDQSRIEGGEQLKLDASG